MMRGLVACAAGLLLLTGPPYKGLASAPYGTRRLPQQAGRNAEG